MFTYPSKSAAHFSSDFARSRSGDDNDLGGNANTCKHALRSEPSPGFRPESPWDHVFPRGLAFWCCGRWRRKWNANSPCMVSRLIRIVVLLWLLESDQLAVRPLCYCTLPLCLTRSCRTSEHRRECVPSLLFTCVMISSSYHLPASTPSASASSITQRLCPRRHPPPRASATATSATSCARGGTSSCRSCSSVRGIWTRGRLRGGRACCMGRRGSRCRYVT